MGHSQEFKKLSPREEFWVDQFVRCVLASIAFIGIFLLQLYRFHFLSSGIATDNESISWISNILNWRYLIFPSIIAIICYFSPDFLRKLYNNHNNL